MNLSFIKLDINILNHTKIKLIRKMPAGSDIIVIWIGLLCLAMKSVRPGVLLISEDLPYSVDWLADELGFSKDTIILALGIFQGFKMIEKLPNGEFFIANFEQHQNLEKIEKLRELSRESSQRYREKQKLLSKNSDNDVTDSDNTDKNKTIDKNRIDYNHYLFLWNSFLKETDLSKIKAITPERKKHIKARVNINKDFCKDYEDCLNIIKKSQFLLGNNDRNWKVYFDWLIENDTNYIKILEGKYSSHDNSLQTSKGPRATEKSEAIAEIVLMKERRKSNCNYFVTKYGIDWTTESLSVHERNEMLDIGEEIKKLEDKINA